MGHLCQRYPACRMDNSFALAFLCGTKKVVLNCTVEGMSGGSCLGKRGYLQLQIGRRVLYDSAAGRLRAGLRPSRDPGLGLLGRPGRALHVRGHGGPWQARVRGRLRGARLHAREQICNCIFTSCQ